MKVISVETVHQIAFLPRLFPINCYFVEEETGLTLIDAALPFCAKKILQSARKIGKPITNIVITHAHDDHVGALDAIKQEMPDVLVYISKRDACLLEGDKALKEGERNTPIKVGVSKQIHTIPDIFLQEGDKVGSLVAIGAPGHTPGSMAFLDARNDALIVGDAFQTRGGLAVAGQLKWLFPFPMFGTWDAEVSLTSAQKLLEYKPSLLATGHGKMIENPLIQMQRAIEEAERNLSRKSL
ncbi:MBL fold metallo-hydrolase [Bacillus thuringiensis]|uniref:MBL fold metallo-hydrolase n=1 Tax=Bacillus cereus TaxID=1396 RepID=UPI000BF18529|nr:MBL fold metallo-hydrolase [Bacillus cereus]MED2788158.1 MBL fold metallo-hydrolase [Bacillus thuringiensis]MED2809602.1 MBL fold metallo-hydrolase [Bacillus thuringiensis]MED2826799.1 MBL fold metallo-hydrolase [Bacillus thuringiensis]MED2831135.1 MBL fold metallo-hydrolase [Bacillus thuringiensis]MED2848550.1 MBL fold metallo-hydrolase [Bacillus thuringiensis]